MSVSFSLERTLFEKTFQYSIHFGDRTTASFARKKAALCLLRCYRRHPDVVPVPDWAEKIIELMDDYDMGVNCSVYSLVSALAAQNLDLFASSLPKVINKLHKVSSNHVPYFD
jgi:AP-2 complex subunit alpha